MAEVVVVQFIAKFAFGFISEKLRDYATEKLKEGDLTDEKFKCYITRELKEINSKLDGICGRELSAGISCLEQGIRRFPDMYLTEASSSETQTRPAQTSVTVGDALALANAIGILKIRSTDVFEKARELFKQAGIEARRAFHNTALSMEMRIRANEVRMASAILEHLDHPEVAVSDCLLFLEELHALPAIRKIFSVHVKGGIKSLFKKDSRREAIKAVTMMNLNLSDFITKFTGRRIAVFRWPMVYCNKLVVHPIHYNEDCFNIMEKMEITPPWDFDLLQKMLKRIAELRGANVLNSRIKSTLCCVPHGDDTKRGLLKLEMPVDSIRDLRLSPVQSSAHCVPVDEDDCVYVLNVPDSYLYSPIFSVRSYHGDGTLINNDVNLEVRDHHHTWRAGEGHIRSVYLGPVEDDNGLIFCFKPAGFGKYANLHNGDGRVVLRLKPKSLKDSVECISVSKNRTVSIPNEHFFRISPYQQYTEIAFVYNGYQLKGVVGLYPNCTDNPSSSPLWDRYFPIIHVTAGGETSRCLHSGDIKYSMSNM